MIQILLMSDLMMVVDLGDSCRYIGLGGGKQLQILYLPGEQTILMLCVDSSDMLLTTHQVLMKFNFKFAVCYSLSFVQVLHIITTDIIIIVILQ